jgi:hypothetical protein
LADQIFNNVSTKAISLLIFLQQAQKAFVRRFKGENPIH